MTEQNAFENKARDVPSQYSLGVTNKFDFEIITGSKYFPKIWRMYGSYNNYLSKIFEVLSISLKRLSPTYDDPFCIDEGSEATSLSITRKEIHKESQEETKCTLIFVNLEGPFGSLNKYLPRAY